MMGWTERLPNGYAVEREEGGDFGTELGCRKAMNEIRDGVSILMEQDSTAKELIFSESCPASLTIGKCNIDICSWRL